ncbi:long-chain fatty acid--CoA ligase [Sphingomonas lacunae]|uniref:3-methylmercaptopropionyl-CoA ligase n=1 Tax=Sphingomonas lacunae TaxID=2698828 RepID=A0A6M4AUP5_9SPHN|nr:long-chain fatty acid--CoA ligase [Sphingomonas lacunae]QJQ32835.1 long-chain fatty acid--CoA ligase [Sphingomonas lacunae]
MPIGGIQQQPLVVNSLIDHAAREHGAREIVTYWADGTLERSSWGDIHLLARKMAQALVRLGMGKGDRIATLAMNHMHHLAAWYGAAGMGGVLHTVNPRLFDEQLVYIMNHASDRVLLFDRAFLPIVERLRPQLNTIEHFILFDSAAEGDYLGFREWVGAEDGHYSWVELAESDPCGLCYTSGTTGNPKGVLYLHRSNVLHALAEMQPDVFDLSARAVALPVVPMFHANAWGLPYAAAAAGAKLVFSCTNDATVLWKLIREEKVTHSAGVPTVWLSMFADLDTNGGDYARLRHVVIGGSAAPRAMIERLMRAGITVAHAWGMTETSPIGTMGARPYNWDDMSFDEQVDMVTKQGRVPYGVELRVVDDNDEVLPRDGTSSGRLQIRGHWIIQRYFEAEADAADADGWFDTGDVAMIHPDGVMQITDRAKDVIKSGGEWISSIELENAAMGAPGVAEAAAVGVPHPKWDERPLLLVVRKPGSSVTADEINAHLVNHVAKWWLPDEIKFVDSLPHTATGKLLKRQLRDEYKSYKLANLG